MSLSRTVARSMVLTVLLAVAMAAPAGAATSVAYVDQGSVWLSTLDGSQKVKLMDPVTVSGDTGTWQEPWIDVAQADSGRIVAVRNKPGRMSSFSWFQAWEPDGTSTVQGPLNAPNGWTVYVYPLSFDITADGKHLVYGYSNSSSCCPISFAQGTYVRAANNNVLQPIDIGGEQHPTLVGNRIVAHAGSNVNVQSIDAGDPYPTSFTPWIDSSGTGLDQSRTDVAASGTIVALEVENTSVVPEVGKIALVSALGLDAPLPAPAAVDCFVPASGVAHEASLSQDATRLAWTDAGGLKVAGTPTTTADPCVMSTAPVLISATGRHPSIGGADVAAFLPKPPAPQPPAPQPPTPQAPVPPAKPPVATPTPPVAPPVAKVKVPAAATKFAAVKRTGALPVSFPLAEAGVRASVTLRLSAKQAKVFGLKPPGRSTTLVIGTGTATSTSAGKVVKVSLRFTRAFRIAFARTILAKPLLRSVTGSLTVTVTRGGLTRVVTKPLRLTR